MQAARRSRVWDVGVLLAVGVLLGGYSYFVSRDRIFWSDELFGWMLVSDPSWEHALRAWNLGADGGGIGFYALGRLWLHVFGRSAVAFRAFSAAGVSAGFAGMWFALRRFYRPEIVAAALSLVWFGSQAVLFQVVQTRFYGLLLGAAAWAFYAGLKSARETDAGEPARAPTLGLVFVANLSLVSAHPFGVSYSGLLLAAAALDDQIARRRRLLFYAAGVLPWAVLLFSRTAMRSSARVGQPWFWTTRPHVMDLVMTYVPNMLPSVHRFGLLVGAAGLLPLLWKSRRRLLRDGVRARRSVLLPAFGLLCVPVVFLLASLGSTSYFVERYFLPYLLGVAVLAAELLTGLFPFAFSWRRPVPLSLAVVTASLLAAGVCRRSLWRYASILDLPPNDFTGELAAMLPRDEPIVIPKADLFDVMVYNRGGSGLPLVFPMDWELAISPESPRWLVSAEREMENWKLAGYYSAQIQDSSALLRTLPRFVVVASDDMPWFTRRIVSQPGWRVQRLGEYRNGFWSSTVWQVTRVP